MAGTQSLTLQCLSGGALYFLKDPADLEKAEQLGAVAVGLSDPSAAGFIHLINRASVNIILEEIDLPLFRETEATLESQTPVTPLVIQETNTPLQDSPHIAIHNLEQLSLSIFRDTLPEAEELETLNQQNLSRKQNTPKASQNDIHIGIIALQGDYHHQRNQILAVGDPRIKVILVQSIHEINQMDALIIPGGWSNVMSQLFSLETPNGTMADTIQTFSQTKPVLAVCAGMILAGSTPGQDCANRNLMGLVTGTINNNALNGPAPIIINGVEETADFSNGPILTDPSETARIIAHIKDKPGQIVALQEGNTIVSATHGNGIHEQFIKYVLKVKTPSRTLGTQPSTPYNPDL